MEFKELKFKDGSTYAIKLDDHCLVVKVGGTKVWLAKAMVKWIAQNKVNINFETNSWIGRQRPLGELKG